MKIALIAICATLLTACAGNNYKTVPYGCDSKEADKYCASVETIFEAAKNNEDRNINVLASDYEIKQSRALNPIQSQNVQGHTVSSDKKSSENHQTKDERINTPSQTLIGSAGLNAKPVYIPERVHRVYRGPWSDDNEIHHSGEHLYYRTPGKWVTSTMKQNGSASGLVSPVKPDELGFNQDQNLTDGKRVGRHIVDANQNSGVKKLN